MARNDRPGGGREGMIRHRSQFLNPLTHHWQERNTLTGQWANVKADKEKFKDVRREN